MRLRPGESSGRGIDRRRLSSALRYGHAEEKAASAERLSISTTYLN